MDPLLAEATAAGPFVAMDELAQRVASGNLGLTLLDVTEKDAYLAGHVPGGVICPEASWSCG